MNLLLCFSFAITICVASGESLSNFLSSSFSLDQDANPLIRNDARRRFARKSPRYRQPFMVAIISRRLKRISCGGSIISTDTILTAAHCFHGKNKEDYYVAAGLDYLDRAVYGTPATRDIAEVRAHPGFRMGDGTSANDIAILQLSKPYSFNSHPPIGPIPMAEDQPIEGMPCTTIGWGIINEDEDEPNPLQENDVIVLGEANCALGMINVTGKDNKLSKFNNEVQNMICVSSDEGNVKPCQGDSGGPLICNNELHGIISFGSVYCTKTENPTYFTKVVAYENWLRTELNKPNKPASPTTSSTTPRSTTKHHRPKWN